MLRFLATLSVTESVTVQGKVCRETGVITDSWTLLTVLSAVSWQAVYSSVRHPLTLTHLFLLMGVLDVDTHFGFGMCGNNLWAGLANKYQTAFLTAFDGLK